MKGHHNIFAKLKPIKCSFQKRPAFILSIELDSHPNPSVHHFKLSIVILSINHLQSPVEEQLKQSSPPFPVFVYGTSVIYKEILVALSMNKNFISQNLVSVNR